MICVHEDVRPWFPILAVQFATLFGANAYIGQADIGTTMIDVHHVTQYDGAVERSPAVTRTEGLGGLGVHSDRVADA